MPQQKESLFSELLNGIQQWMIRQIEPPKMCFEVVQPSIDNDWMMPTIYLIQKSIEWQEWIPSNMEKMIFEEQFAGCSTSSSNNSNCSSSSSNRKTRLLMIQEENGDQKYSKAIENILLAIKKRSKELDHHKRIQIVPVYAQVALSTSGSSTPSIQKLKNPGRMIAIRKAEPIILLVEHIIKAYEEDPLETLHHLSSRVHTSLRFHCPKTMYQLELINLCRGIYTGTGINTSCSTPFNHFFSARQIASINEELLQIHVRTRKHPDMQELKTCLRQYNDQLKRFSFDVEDFMLSNHPPVSTWFLIVRLAQEIIKSIVEEMIWKIVKRPGPTREDRVYLVIFCGVLVVIMWTLQRYGQVLLMTMMTLLIVVLFAMKTSSSDAVHTTNRQVDNLEMSSSYKWWKKRFGLFISTKELDDLKIQRQKIQKLIFSLVDRYRNIALPVPMVCTDSQHQVNVHHTIVLNLFPPVLVENCLTLEEKRCHCYAPQMLRDDHWRTLYDTVAAASSNLIFHSLLTSKKPPLEGLALVKYLQSKSLVFEWVLTAFILHLSTGHSTTNEIPSATSMEETTKTLDETQVVAREEMIHRILQMA